MTTVTKEMSIGEVLSIHHGTTRVFMDFGMHCLTCPMAIMESLEEASQVHGVNVDELVDQLNAFLSDAEEEE